MALSWGQAQSAPAAVTGSLHTDTWLDDSGHRETDAMAQCCVDSRKPNSKAGSCCHSSRQPRSATQGSFPGELVRHRKAPEAGEEALREGRSRWRGCSHQDGTYRFIHFELSSGLGAEELLRGRGSGELPDQVGEQQEVIEEEPVQLLIALGLI